MAEETTLNIYQKLAKIRAISDVAQKSKQGYGYTYSDITEILAKVTAGMKKYGISLIPSIVPGTSEVVQNVTVNTKVDKSGKTYEHTATEMLYKADMIYKWVNDSSPDEYIEVPWFVTGSQSDPSQAVGSGLTYTERQFLTHYFQIAQPLSDPDNYRSKQKAAEASEDREIAEAIVEEVDLLVRDLLSKNKDKADEIKKFIGNYVKGSDYFKIKDPKVAAKLLEDFKNTYTEEK